MLAILIMWRTSRYDLKGAAFDSAWQVARGKRTAENPTEIEKRLGEITSEASVTGKATRAAGTVIGHFAAQVLGVVGVADAARRRRSRGGGIFLDVRSHDDHSISKRNSCLRCFLRRAL